MLSQNLSPRNWQHPDNLDKCAAYISQHFSGAGAEVEVQEFGAQGKRYRNVIGRFGKGKGPKIIFGAHYDACGEMPGADDNASGVASLIELAYLLGQGIQDREIELVAYALEEPPFFRSQFMGSAVHAKSISGQKANIKGVIVLEMLGCFNDDWGSQSYPSPLLYLMYPSRGNFITVVGTWEQGNWVKQIKSGMNGVSNLPVYSIRAPVWIPGIDFSDHMNYWPYEINAVMITDTAFYRNRAYHGTEDTLNHLDYARMSKVVVAVFGAVQSLGK